MTYQTLLVGMMSGGLGALAATFVSIYFTQHAARRTLTLELHREFSSPEFYEFRNKGERTIRDNPGKTLENFHKTFCAKEYAENFIVLPFFERLAVCYQSKAIDRDLTHNLFGEKFIYWYFLMERAGLFETDWDYAFAWQSLKQDIRAAKNYPMWVEKGSAQ